MLAAFGQRALSWVHWLQLEARQRARLSAAFGSVSSLAAHLRLKAAAACQRLASAVSTHWQTARLGLRSSAAWKQLLLTLQRLVLALRTAAEHIRAQWAASRSPAPRPAALPARDPTRAARAQEKPATEPAQPLALASKAATKSAPGERPALPASGRLQAYWRHLRLPGAVARLAPNREAKVMQGEHAQQDGAGFWATIRAVLAAAAVMCGVALALNYAVTGAHDGVHLAPSSTPAVGGRVRWARQHAAADLPCTVSFRHASLLAH